MAAKKTWFLPPDFTLFPDGELRLGSIIPHPSRPTAVLGSLFSQPPTSIALPSVRIDTQSNHSHRAVSEISFNLDLFTNAANIISGKANIETKRYLTRSFGPVDIDVHSFSAPLSPDTISGIMDIPRVKEYMESSIWARIKKRPVYLITGLSVAKDSFTVKEEIGTIRKGNIDASVTLPTGAVLPLETGVAMGGGWENTGEHEYNTAPGVIFSYRCHIIDAKGHLESFTSTEGFYTGSGDEDEDEELEVRPVTENFVKMDGDEEVGFAEVEVGDEAWIIFLGRKQ